MRRKFRFFINRIKRIVILTINKAMDPYFSGASAEVAFFLLVSLAPSMLLLGQLLNVFQLSVEVIGTLLTEYVSDEIANVIIPILEAESSGILSVMLIVLAFWGASKALFSLMRITNYAYLGGAKVKSPLRNWFKERARAILTIFIILFTLTFAVLVVIFGKVILAGILTYLNDYLGGDYDVDAVWLNIRWVIGFIMYFFMVISIYYLLPSMDNSYRQLVTDNKWETVKKVVWAWLTNAKITFRTIFPGSIFATIGIMVVTWGYSMYLGSISLSNFNILYGSLGAAVMLLLWFYILAYVLILGIQLNSIWEESKYEPELEES